jgi:hypothetical protein
VSDELPVPLTGPVERAAFKGATLTPTALVLTDPNLPAERFETIGRYLGALRDGTAWWLGDWMNFGEGVYGESAYQLAESAGRSPQTMKSYRWVADRVVRSRRREGLSWSHHQVVAALEPREQKRWLDRAEREALGRAELRELIGAPGYPANPGSPKVELAAGDARSIAAAVLSWSAGDAADPELRRVREAAERLGDAASNGAVAVTIRPGGRPCPTCGGSGEEPA